MSETGLDTRAEKRLKLVFQAVVTDRNGEIELSCLIRDGSASGCRLVSGQVDILPKDILLKVKGIREPIPGRIMWRRKKMAGVKFHWKRLSGSGGRRAKRNDTAIPVKISADRGGRAFDGMIVDASVSGARLLSTHIHRMPDSVFIAAEGIAAPIQGRIVWRKDNEAGIALRFPETGAGGESVREQKQASAPAEDDGVIDLLSENIVELES